MERIRGAGPANAPPIPTQINTRMMLDMQIDHETVPGQSGELNWAPGGEVVLVRGGREPPCAAPCPGLCTANCGVDHAASIVRLVLILNHVSITPPEPG